VEGEMKDQVKKNKPHYPTEPFVKTYERHVEKWGEILEDPNRVNTKWNLSFCFLPFGHDDITGELYGLMTSIPFQQSGIHTDLGLLMTDLQVDELLRIKVQRVLFDSYVHVIENEKDVEYVTERDSEYGYDNHHETKWKKQLVEKIDGINRSGNNPFDIIWYLGTTDYLIRRFILIPFLATIITISVMTLLYLPFILINN
jgi:hypothetical protein